MRTRRMPGWRSLSRRWNAGRDAPEPLKYFLSGSAQRHEIKFRRKLGMFLSKRTLELQHHAFVLRGFGVVLRREFLAEGNLVSAAIAMIEHHHRLDVVQRLCDLHVIPERRVRRGEFR